MRRAGGKTRIQLRQWAKRFYQCLFVNFVDIKFCGLKGHPAFIVRAMGINFDLYCYIKLFKRKRTQRTAAVIERTRPRIKQRQMQLTHFLYIYQPFSASVCFRRRCNLSHSYLTFVVRIQNARRCAEHNCFIFTKWTVHNKVHVF